MCALTTPKRIVIVDDDPDFLEYTRIVLRSAGYEVEVAAGAEEGLALIRATSPDLVISDVMMSYSMEEGIGLAHALTHDPLLAHIPLFVVTSIARSLEMVGYDEETARGIRAFLVKPVAPTELLDRIGRFFSGKGD